MPTIRGNSTHTVWRPTPGSLTQPAHRWPGRQRVRRGRPRRSWKTDDSVSRADLPFLIEDQVKTSGVF